MRFSRRDFLGVAGLGAAAWETNCAAVPGEPGGRQPRLAFSTYSYWHFQESKVGVEAVIDKAGEYGADGVDLLHRQMEKLEGAALRELKRRAFRAGVALVCLSIHQDFVTPDEAERGRQIEHTLRGIDLAHELGIPCMRIIAGRWKTAKTFEQLMKLRGEEPPLTGYTEDDAFRWCIDAIEKCLPRAAEQGVLLALENHWGLTRNPEGVLRIVNAIDSPWLGVLMDTGNFLEEPYEKLKAIAPRTVFVQAKTYDGGGEWYTLKLDYRRIAQILADAHYRGYVSLEFEGKEDPDRAVPRGLAMLREALAGVSWPG